jgi:predicted RNase H-like HicB family nuclease
MKKYLIVVEKTGTGYSAYSPDLDGCVATGTTREEVESQMREAIEFHLEGMAASPYRNHIRIPAMSKFQPGLIDRTLLVSPGVSVSLR